MSFIEADMGTFRDGDFLSADQGELVKKTILNLCGSLKKHIIPFIETFYPGDWLLDSMIAPADGDLYGSIINKIYSAPKAFERISNWRTLYK